MGGAVYPNVRRMADIADARRTARTGGECESARLGVASRMLRRDREAVAILETSMDSSDITMQLLAQIRDEIRTTRGELGAEIRKTNLRLDQTNLRLERLEQRVVASEIRVATALTEVAGTVREVRDRLDDRLELRDRVERCEHDIADLKQRLT
jgi:hypothetical protein